MFLGRVSTQSQVSRRYRSRRGGSVGHGQFLPSIKSRYHPIHQARKQCFCMEHPGDIRSQKTARALERETAVKRGGGRTRIALDDLETDLSASPSVTEANELCDEIHSLLNSDHSQLLELLLENKTQREIAEQLGIDERTIRRRIKSMQDIVKRQLASADDRSAHHSIRQLTHQSSQYHYRQFVLGKLVGSGALGKVYRARLQSDGHRRCEVLCTGIYGPTLIADSHFCERSTRIEDQPQRNCKVSRMGTVATRWPLSCLRVY